MALYDASGNQLTVAQLRQILSQYSSGEENVTRVYDANGEAISGRSGMAAREAIGQELESLGWDSTGTSYRGDGGSYLVPLDDPNKLAQAQSLGAVQDVNGVSTANYNDPNLRGGIGSGALFQDMPQTGFVGDILTNPAFLAATGLAAGFGSGLLGAGTEAGTVAGGGVGGGAGGTIGGNGLLDYSMTGTLGGGVGTTAAGNTAAATLAAGAPLAEAIGPYSLASGVGGGLGGAATLGAGGAGAYSLGSGLANGLGSAAGSAVSSSGASGVGPGAAAGLGAAASGLNNLFGTNLSDADAKILGSLLGGGLDLYGSLQKNNTLQDIYNQSRADRSSALNAFNDALAHPDTYYSSAPAMGSVDAVLRKLSVQGNPADNPGSLAKAAAYNLGGYNDYLRTLAGPAFGGQAATIAAGTNAANASADPYNVVGRTVGDITNPQTSLSDLMKQINGGGLTVGGLRV